MRALSLICLRGLLVCGLVLGAIGHAGTFTVDDSQSQVLDGNMPMRWRSVSPARGDHIVQGATRVQVRLNTAAWVGKSVRIYMALPAQPHGNVLAAWQTQSNVLLSGQLNSGQRGLVWSGVVPSALLEDTMVVTVQTDGRLLAAAQSLRFYFEVDVP